MRIVRLITITSGVVGRIVASKRLESAMSKPENKLEGGRPVIVPEYFTGEGSFEDWIDQFKSIAEINHWNDGQKLIWLKVHLTGRALMAYKKFSVTARGSFKNAIKALQERFEPESRKDLYCAEFNSDSM